MFLKEPAILLLDEATASLDKFNESAIQDAIDGYRKEVGNVTVIVIAHRISTIQDSDKIFVMKGGVLCEQGSHESLLREYPEGIYAGFTALQAAAESPAVTNNGDTSRRLSAVSENFAESQKESEVDLMLKFADE